jgi:hypothetical protein
VISGERPFLYEDLEMEALEKAVKEVLGLE